MKAYKLYDLENNSILISRDVVFHENNFRFYISSNNESLENFPLVVIPRIPIIEPLDSSPLMVFLYQFFIHNRLSTLLHILLNLLSYKLQMYDSPHDPTIHLLIWGTSIAIRHLIQELMTNHSPFQNTYHMTIYLCHIKHMF